MYVAFAIAMTATVEKIANVKTPNIQGLETR